MSAPIRLVHVSVTAEDIAQGQPQSYCRCPVALALTRAADSRWVEVIADEARFARRGRYMAETASLPSVVQRFIDAFDRGQPVEPFEFDLEFAPWR